MAVTRLCSVSDCGNPARTRGYCIKHYDRWKRWGDPTGGRTPTGEALRFLRDFVLGYRGTKCLIWPYATDSNGYGNIAIDGVNHRVSRYVCLEVHGAPPSPDHQAAHSCGNSACCSPHHIIWKTQAENESDKIAHGRRAYPRGEKNARSKLTAADVLRIRALGRSKSQSAIAREYAVSSRTICDIVNLKKWRHL